MSSDPSTGLWRVRREDAAGDGRAISLAELAAQIADGVWHESDQVRDPRTGRWGLVGNHPDLEEFAVLR